MRDRDNDMKRDGSKSLRSFFSKNLATWFNKPKGGHGRIRKTSTLVFRLTLIALLASNAHAALDRQKAGQEIMAMSEAKLQSLPADKLARFYTRMSGMGDPEGSIDKYLPMWPRAAANGIFVSLADPKPLHRLHVNTTITQEFRDYYMPHYKTFSVWLQKAPLIDEAEKKWAGMSQEERFFYLNRIAAKQSEIFGFEPTIVTPFNKAPMTLDAPECDLADQQFVTYGTHKAFFPQRVLINVNEAAKFDDFHAVLETMTHEVTHAHDWKLAKQVSDGTLPKDDPRYAQASIFLANQFIKGTSLDAYPFYPTETHAFWIQHLTETHHHAPGHSDVKAQSNGQENRNLPWYCNN